MSKLLREQKFDAWWAEASQSWTATAGDVTEDVARLAYAAGQAALPKRKELQGTLDLLHDSDMRAIKMWRKAHPGNELVWPDRAEMILWLLEQLTPVSEIIRHMPHSSHDLACKLSHSPIAVDAVPGKPGECPCYRCRLESALLGRKK